MLSCRGVGDVRLAAVCRVGPFASDKALICGRVGSDQPRHPIDGLCIAVPDLSAGNQVSKGRTPDSGDSRWLVVRPPDIDVHIEPFTGGRVVVVADRVEWHMRRDLAPLLFEDDDREGARA